MSKFKKTLLVVLFGIFFGMLEAIVVVYLRYLIVDGAFSHDIASRNSIVFSLGLIAFLDPSASLTIIGNSQLLFLETLRELATIGMLLTLALAVGNIFREKLAYFLLAFAIWDIFYYVFLKLFIGWPTSLGSLDVFFLIPVVWVGPIITPIMASLVMIGIAVWLLSSEGAKRG